MPYYAGLDVSLEETSVCIVDECGERIGEFKVLSEPSNIATCLKETGYTFSRVGLEAGPLSQWLYEGLIAEGLPAICVETRHMKKLLSAERVKTDRNDARGIARMMRAGLYKPVHVKSRTSQEHRALLTSRALVKGQRRAVENEIRGVLRNFGLKVGQPGVAHGAFENRIRELLEGEPGLLAIIEPMLKLRRHLLETISGMDKDVLAIARSDEVCRQLMSVPGVGPLVALTFRASVDNPARFTRSRGVGAHFGLTPILNQSGESTFVGSITRWGDGMVREALYRAAHVLMTQTGRWFPLKSWAMQVAKRRGVKIAKVALARKLACIMHRMWIDGTEFGSHKEGKLHTA